MDGHQEPAVVVDAPLEELLTEPVPPKAEVLPDASNPELDELEEVEESVAHEEPVELDAYASARWSPSPPTARCSRRELRRSNARW